MQVFGVSGEPLGTIRRHKDDVSLPGWKTEMTSKPSASVRKGIAWGFAQASEDTDTLVLTARSGRFVDIRFPKEAKSSQDTLGHESFWAFSGTAMTSFYDAKDEPFGIGLSHVAHCVFEHDIDTRGKESAAAGDKGDMFLLGNGDCMEMGIMMNPRTGRNELYKEYWAAAPRLQSDVAENKSNLCVVAEARDGNDPGKVQGWLVRHGGRIQLILSLSSSDTTQKTMVERWTRSSEGLWARDERSTGAVLDQQICEELGRKQLEVGHILSSETCEWIVREAKW